MKYGYKIKHLLELRGMTQEKLAEKSGVSKSLIAALANDQRTSTTDTTLEKIADALGVDVAYFFNDKRITPFELVEEMPAHIKKFILSKKNIDWLELAYSLEEAKKSPQITRQIISLYDEMIGMQEKENK